MEALLFSTLKGETARQVRVADVVLDEWNHRIRFLQRLVDVLGLSRLAEDQACVAGAIVLALAALERVHADIEEVDPDGLAALAVNVWSADGEVVLAVPGAVSQLAGGGVGGRGWLADHGRGQEGGGGV